MEALEGFENFHSDYRFEYIKFNFGLINNNS